MIALCEPASVENFDEGCYLIINPDVAAAAVGSKDFGSRHLMEFGLAEGRTQLSRAGLDAVVAQRADKLKRFSVSLPLHSEPFFGVELTMAWSGDPDLPVPYDRISAHEYDVDLASWIDSSPDARFLDVGAGLRSNYRENVLYAEIAALPSTDVLASAESLPFDDGLFDGVISLAVLEHVSNPWKAARELLRVVKHGGQVVVDWPFLQPVHGYPHHYFNATEEGARKVFEELGAEVTSTIPWFQHPIFSLRWILEEWHRGLPDDQREAFAALTVGDFLAQTAIEHGSAPWVTLLSASTQRVINAGTRLFVRRL